MIKTTAQDEALQDLQGIVFEQDVAVEMSDGIHLMTNVFRPKAQGRYPVILSVSPYGKDDRPLDWAYFNRPDMGVGKIETSLYTAFEAPDPAFWVAQGYVVIHGNVRGMWNSEGIGSWLSKRDAQDYFDLIEWAAAQPFADGKVGLCGVSYLAMSQWAVAALRPPHLRAIIPWEGASDMYREFMGQGGIPETKFFPAFFGNRVTPHRNQASPPAPDLVAETRAHPYDDAFWAEMRPDLSRIDVPALICTSWSDQGMHTRGSLEGFKQSASEQKWLYTHGRRKWETFYSREAGTLQLRFFDYFLKGADNGMADVPRVRIEVRRTSTTYDVREEPEWPVAGLRPVRWHLDAANAALDLRVPAVESTLSYSSAQDGSAADRAEFDIRFDHDVELTGGMSLKLWVEIVGGNDTDLFVGVRKFDLAGQEVTFSGYQGYPHDLVAKGWMRASARELDMARSTPLQPWFMHRRAQWFEPGEVAPVRVEIWPSSTFFERGSSLRLVVQGKELIDYPMFGHDAQPPVIVRLHTGGRYDAHLSAPFVDQSAG